MKPKCVRIKYAQTMGEANKLNGADVIDEGVDDK